MDPNDVLGAIARFASFLQRSPDGMPSRVWSETQPWLSALLAHATSRWLPTLQRGERCEMVLQDQRTGQLGSCHNHAVGQCDVCRSWVCLGHAAVDGHASVVCLSCVAQMRELARTARQQQRPPTSAPPWSSAPPPPPRDAPPPPPPREPPMSRAAALKVLGLKGTATEEQIRAAYRRKSAEHHPDRKRTPAEKQKAHERFLEVQRAYEALK